MNDTSETLTASIDVNEGAAVPRQAAYGAIPEGVRPPWPVDVWWGLLQNRVRWLAETGSGRQRRRAVIDSETRSLLSGLDELPATRWASLCVGAGWCADGASGLSWCKDISLKHVLSAFHQVPNLDFSPNSGDVRAMRLINPALLPQGRISDLMILSEDSFDMAILLYACSGHLAIDYSLHELARLNPPAQQVLVQRLEQVAEPDEDETTLLAALRHASP